MTMGLEPLTQIVSYYTISCLPNCLVFLATTVTRRLQSVPLQTAGAQTRYLARSAYKWQSKASATGTRRRPWSCLSSCALTGFVLSHRTRTRLRTKYPRSHAYVNGRSLVIYTSTSVSLIQSQSYNLCGAKSGNV